jgi:hypothetical protein
MSSATRASSYQQALDLFHDLDDRFHQAETAANIGGHPLRRRRHRRRTSPLAPRANHSRRARPPPRRTGSRQTAAHHASRHRHSSQITVSGSVLGAAVGSHHRVATACWAAGQCRHRRRDRRIGGNPQEAGQWLGAVLAELATRNARHSSDGSSPIASAPAPSAETPYEMAAQLVAAVAHGRADDANALISASCGVTPSGQVRAPKGRRGPSSPPTVMGRRQK